MLLVSTECHHLYHFQTLFGRHESHIFQASHVFRDHASDFTSLYFTSFFEIYPEVHLHSLQSGDTFNQQTMLHCHVMLKAVMTIRDTKIELD